MAPRSSLSKAQQEVCRISAERGISLRTIAKTVGVSPATVSRALARGRTVPDRVRKAADFSGVAVAAAQQRRGPQTSWSLEAIRSARDGQARGDFSQAVKLAEAMRTDDSLFSAYHARLAPQASVDAKLVARGGVRGEAVAKRAAASVFAPRSVLAGITGTMANHGVAVGYVEQEPSDDGETVALKLREWPLEFVKFNPSTEQLETTVKDGGARVPIVHGDGRWCIFKKFSALPWIQEAAVLPASFVWAAHAGGIQDWAGASRSHGMAKVVGELPEGVALIADESGDFTPEAQAFLSMLTGLVNGEFGVGIQPAGAKTDFLANGSTAWQVFSELIVNREKAAARIYTGTDAILGAAGGAPGVDISMLFGVASTKVQGDFEAIEQALETGLYQPWAALNFGDSRYAPCLKYQLPDPDAKQKAEENAAKRERFHAEIKRHKENGFLLDQHTVEKLAREFGIAEPPALVSVAQSVSLVLAPTDVARVTRGWEARASQGLPPFGDERDDMTIPEIEESAKAKAAARSPAPVIGA